MNSSEREVALHFQERFEFYLVGLVFTLLALSIQTANFGHSYISNVFELLGWFFFAFSGIIGLSRLEYIPVIRNKIAIKNEFDQKIDELRELELKGVQELFVLETQSNEPIKDRLSEYQRGVEVLDPVITNLEKSGYVKYQIHRFTFVAGIFLIMCARGHAPLKQIILTLKNFM